MKTLLFLLACLLGGCAHPIDAEPIDGEPVQKIAHPPLVLAVQVSDRFEAYRGYDYTAAIVAAAEQWQRATAGRVQVSVQVTDSLAATGVQVRPATAGDVRDQLIEGWQLGSATHTGADSALVLLNGGTIGQRSAEKGVPFEQIAEMTALHEFGHVLGLGHAERGLMYPTNAHDAPACIDATTLAAFCQLHGCPPEAAPTCEQQ